MPVLLVRHAKAGSRHQWHDDDDLRPLSAKGQRQAKGLIALLSPFEPRRIMSSPSVRCVQTVEPLAEALGLTVEVADELMEGRGQDAVGFAGKLLGEHVVLCTHGDVIPAILDALVPDLPDPLPCAKGSTWVLEPVAGTKVQASHLPPTS
jgi:broad specificity phosphatase PhoE